MEILGLIVDKAARTFHVTGAHVAVGVISGLAVIVCALLHYEFMSITSRRLALTLLPRRARVLGLMMMMLIAHVLEVWIFAGIYWFLDKYPSLGHLDGPFEEGALDFIYFSAVAFTTVGFGDIVPMGAIRILSGTECLVGFSLITWSASLAFLEMQSDWAEFRHPTLARRRRDDPPADQASPPTNSD